MLSAASAHPRRRRRRPAAALAGGLALALAALAAAVAPPAARPAAPTATRTAAAPTSVALGAGPGGPAVPERFLGLSFEAQSVPDLARLATTGDLPLLLRSLGPGVLRIGGVTADSQAAFVAPGATPPSWATTTLSPSDLSGLAALAGSARDQVLLTVGLAHDDAAAAAREAAAARAALGDSLLALEIGNEPDAYGQHGLRPQPWTFAHYAPEIGTYRAAIAAAAPGVAIAGPDTTGAKFAAWGPDEARVERPTLLTAHRYPLVCSALPAPSIAGLLSAATRGRTVAQLSSDAVIARAAHIPLRIDETNSVSCGGRAGVSDTFASSLWAVQLMTEAMQLGITGVNFHDLPANCHGYSPLCATSPAALAAGRLQAAPEWYGLLLLRSLAGTRPLTTSLRGGDAVTAAAFRGRGVVRVVLVDTSASGAARTVRIAVGPGARAGDALALTAPSLAATAGVRIGGRAVDAAGELRGPLSRTPVPVTGGIATTSLASASALLVTVPTG